MEMNEFNALALREDDHVKVVVNEPLEAPGLTGEETSPRIGYLYGISESGYDTYIMVSTLPQKDFGGYAQIHRLDIKEVKVFERNKEGALVQMAKREDGKGICIAKESQ